MRLSERHLFLARSEYNNKGLFHLRIKGSVTFFKGDLLLPFVIMFESYLKPSDWRGSLRMFSQPNFIMFAFQHVCAERYR